MSVWHAALARAEQQHRSSVPSCSPESGEVGTRSTIQPGYRVLPLAPLRVGFGYVQGAWRWLEQKRSERLVTRRLRVAETISLGEKRFVSILQVDGVQMLIGGSAAGVQLLAMLDNQELPPHADKAAS